MNRHNRRALRGLIAARADVGNAAELLTRLNQAFEEFKASNDARIKEIEKRGSADAVTVEKVENINGEITDILRSIQALEARANRPGAGSTAREAELEAARARFNLTIRAQAMRLSRTPPGELNMEQYRAYGQAFNSFLRTSNLTPAVQNALSVGSDPDGGYVCPPEIDMTIDRVVTQLGSMRSLATVRPIGGSSFKKLVTTSGASAGGWGGETTAPSETGTPALAELEFTPGLLWAEPRATSMMLEDSAFDAEAWLGDEVGLTFVEQEGDTFIDGSGVNRPRGFLSYPMVANASYGWGNIGFTVTGGAAGFAASNPSDALIDLIHSLKRQYRQGASFITNDLTLAAIRKFKDGQGIYLWAPSGLTGGQVGVLLGYPVATDDFMPDLGSNTFPVGFADFRRGYLIVDRRGTVVIRDNLTSKPYVKFYTTRRIGGGVQNFEAIKVLKCST